jgi:hypothetical protein
MNLSQHLGALVLVVFSAFLVDAVPARAQENPPGRVARISYLKGNVSFLPAGQDQWSQATPNFVVTSGDRLFTDYGAKAELEGGLYAVRLSETTDLSITDLTDAIVQLGLGRGVQRVSVYQLPQGNSFEIDTPNGPLTVSQAGRYRIESDSDRNRTRIMVDRGTWM